MTSPAIRQAPGPASGSAPGATAGLRAGPWLVGLAAALLVAAAVGAALLATWDPAAIARFAQANRAVSANEGQFQLDIPGMQTRAAWAAAVYAVLALGVIAGARPLSGAFDRVFGETGRIVGHWPAALQGMSFDIWWVGVLTGCTLVGLIVAGALVPMRLDESTTFLNFANRPVAIALGYYATPNNHILHTLLMKVSVALFGESPLAIRAPAILFGAMLPSLAYVAARRLFDPTIGRVFSVLLPGSAYFLEIAANARGYSIVLAAFLAGMALLPGALRGRRAAAAGLCLVGVVGAYAVPIMVYPFAILLLWLVIGGMVGPTATAISGLRTAVMIGAITLVVTLLLYSSVLVVTGVADAGPVQIIASGLDAGAPADVAAPDERFLTLAQFLREAVGQWLFPLTGWAAPAAAVLVLVGVVASIAHSWRGASLVAATTLGVATVYLMSARAAPPPWSLCFLYVLAILMASCGWVSCCRLALPRRIATPTAEAGSVALALGLVAATLASSFPHGVPKAFHFPDGPVVARAVADLLGDDDMILSREAEYPPLRYALRRLGAPWRQPRIAPNAEREIPPGRGVLVVDRRDSGEPPLEEGRLPASFHLVRSFDFKDAVVRYYRAESPPPSPPAQSP